MMTTGGVGVQLEGTSGWTLEGHVGSDRERGAIGLRVFEF